MSSTAQSYMKNAVGALWIYRFFVLLIVLMIAPVLQATQLPEQCIALQHSSSALVDCAGKSAKLFSQPGCVNAHIATVDGSRIAVALRHSIMFADVLQTICQHSTALEAVVTDEHLVQNRQPWLTIPSRRHIRLLYNLNYLSAKKNISPYLQVFPVAQ
jgi:hypothetical protein